MTSMDKMWASLIAMGLMAIASVLITYARRRKSPMVRGILSLIAFLLFVPILLLMLVSIT